MTEGLQDNEDLQGICPDGWHLPSDNEWTTLNDFLAQDSYSTTLATSLKATYGWNTNGDGTDDYNFTALPGGHRIGTTGTFVTAGYVGFWWTSTVLNESKVHTRSMERFSESLKVSFDEKSNGSSIRCLRY